jgi:hypothetical protein
MADFSGSAVDRGDVLRPFRRRRLMERTIGFAESIGTAFAHSVELPEETRGVEWSPVATSREVKCCERTQI